MRRVALQALVGWLGCCAFVLAPQSVRGEKVAAMPAPAGYVDDYAGVLSAAAKTELEGLCRDVHEQTRAQVFLVTVKSLSGESVDTFANDLFAKWKIGEKKTDRGVLLLLATGDHKWRIETGYGLEGVLNDAKVGDIGREMVPELRAANYDEAARIGVRGVSRVIAADAGVTIASLSTAEEAQTGAESDAAPPPVPDGIGRPSAPPLWPFLVFPGFFFGVFGLITWGMFRNRGRGTATGGSADDSPTVWGSGGSSDSSDSSSSSDSFSGGDGGSSGGGGASGSW